MIKKKIFKYISIYVILILCISCMISPTSYAKQQEKQMDKASKIQGPWSFTDDLGRTPEQPASQTRQNKYVGIFYHILSEGGNSVRANNASEIFEKYPDALTNAKRWSARQEGYYWGEPIYGYYDMAADKYVLRKHAQLLSDAGVDTVIIDYSNACVNGVENSLTSHYKDILIPLCDTWMEIRKSGGKTPQITFLMTWSDVGAAAGFAHLYEDLYSNPKYAELWFHWNNKILVVGSGNEVASEYKDMFEFRQAWPYYAAPETPNSWPWLSVYPQEPGFTEDNDCEIVAVSVAQNWHDGITKKQYCYFSDRDADGNFIAQGRSFTYDNKKLLKDPISDEYGSKYGANFQQQWDRAIELDPDFIFITGWNESCVARFISDEQPVLGKFCDQFTTEFSRDIEPTLQGDLKDNFYCQMIINIKRFKGEKVDVAISDKDSGAYKSISVDGDFSDWDSVALSYDDDTDDTAIRDAGGFGILKYKNETGRNDFKSSKIAYDDNNVYFYVETKDPISTYTDMHWMNLFIGILSEDGKIRSDLPNWEGFQYVLNRNNVASDVTRLEKSKGGWDWEVANDFVAYRVNSNKMEIAIPRSSLGLQDTGRKINIIFKWSDNIDSNGDILKFYQDGDTLPNARFYNIFSNSVKESKPTKLLGIVLGITGFLLVAVGIVVVFLKKIFKKKG